METVKKKEEKERQAEENLRGREVISAFGLVHLVYDVWGHFVCVLVLYDIS